MPKQSNSGRGQTGLLLAYSIAVAGRQPLFGG
jgi:hypothetical protein